MSDGKNFIFCIKDPNWQIVWFALLFLFLIVSLTWEMKRTLRKFSCIPIKKYFYYWLIIVEWLTTKIWKLWQVYIIICHHSPSTIHHLFIFYHSLLWFVSSSPYHRENNDFLHVNQFANSTLSKTIFDALLLIKLSNACHLLVSWSSNPSNPNVRQTIFSCDEWSCSAMWVSRYDNHFEGNNIIIPPHHIAIITTTKS